MAEFLLVRMFFGRLPDRIGGLPVAIGSLAIEVIGQFLIWEQPLHPRLSRRPSDGLGASLMFPAMGREVVRLVVEPHLRGTAIGGFAAFQDLAYGLTGPWPVFWSTGRGMKVFFLIGGIAAALALLIALWLQRAQTAVFH